MSIPMWSLFAFAGWTLVILIAGIGLSRWSLILTGRKQLTDFPADQPHGGVAYRRIVRAHANCVENLPVYGAIVLSIEISGVALPAIDTLAVAFIGARMLQSLTHMLFPESNLTVAVRFAFFLAQLIFEIAMAVLLVRALM